MQRLPLCPLQVLFYELKGNYTPHHWKRDYAKWEGKANHHNTNTNASLIPCIWRALCLSLSRCGGIATSTLKKKIYYLVFSELAQNWILGKNITSSSSVLQILLNPPLSLKHGGSPLRHLAGGTKTQGFLFWVEINQAEKDERWRLRRASQTEDTVG